jgi:hypothetical protein
MKGIAVAFFLLMLFVRCSDPDQKKESLSSTETKVINKKPGSSYQDTLVIREACAVFYQPDSIQKEKIKAVTEKNVFESSMHEFFYQQRNAHIFLKKYWTHLKIAEASNYRYLIFIKKDKSTALIDLDHLGDSYGIILFDPVKSPRPADMMNIETEVQQYFKSR